MLCKSEKNTSKIVFVSIILWKYKRNLAKYSWVQLFSKVILKKCNKISKNKKKDIFGSIIFIKFNEIEKILI